jgi:hypothetical protein
MKAIINTFENLIKNQNDKFISEVSVFNSPVDVVELRPDDENFDLEDYADLIGPTPKDDEFEDKDIYDEYSNLETGDIGPKGKPVIRVQENENIFFLIGMAAKALKAAGFDPDVAKKMGSRIQGGEAKSYEDALRILDEYVERI